MRQPTTITPEGNFVSTPVRGLFMGNRGILHDAEGRIGAARWQHRNWVCCVLSFKGRRRAIRQPGHYTELFFLDEAVALAAGHRPCAECRRADHIRYRAAWARATGTLPSAPDMDRALHAARALPGARQQRHETLPAEALPAGCMVRAGPAVLLLQDGAARACAPEGYGPPVPRPSGPVLVLTPAPSRAVLAAGYVPLLHPSAA